eukprot:4282458-Prymnesium_polylepis.2
MKSPGATSPFLDDRLPRLAVHRLQVLDAVFDKSHPRIVKQLRLRHEEALQRMGRVDHGMLKGLHEELRFLAAEERSARVPVEAVKRAGPGGT